MFVVGLQLQEQIHFPQLCPLSLVTCCKSQDNGEQFFSFTERFIYYVICQKCVGFYYSKFEVSSFSFPFH